MTDFTELTTIQQPAGEVLPAGNTLDQNPAAVYLAALPSPGAQVTQRKALDTIARLVMPGSDALTFPWSSMRYQHAAAIRAQLIPRYSVATVNRLLSALRGTLRQAWQLGQMTAEEYQAAAAVRNVKGETLPAGRELQPGELSALLDACAMDTTPAGARDAAVIALMYGAGLRREEVTKLDLSDFDQAAGRLVVRGKGRKERTSYLIDGATDALGDWLTIRGQDPGPLFYPVLKSGKLQQRRLTTQAIYNLLEKRGEEAGVKKFSPHDMRRTFVSDLLEAGADIATVAKMAGHANVTTTARYDRRGEQAKQKAAGLLHVPYRRKIK